MRPSSDIVPSMVSKMVDCDPHPISFVRCSHLDGKAYLSKLIWRLSLVRQVASNDECVRKQLAQSNEKRRIVKEGSSPTSGFTIAYLWETADKQRERNIAEDGLGEGCGECCFRVCYVLS